MTFSHHRSQRLTVCHTVLALVVILVRGEPNLPKNLKQGENSQPLYALESPFKEGNAVPLDYYHTS